MKKKFFYGMMCLALAFSTGLTACGGETSGSESTSDNSGTSGTSGTTPTTISNEENPLVVSSEALDSVFNPYFYTSGADGDVVGQTQIGMLSTDKDGNIVCGQDEPTVALAYTTETVGTQANYDKEGTYENYYTDYWFAIKNGVKFSDGEDLTIKDVLFNLYVLLDPAYTGSSTLYSVDIQGLAAYRTDTEDENQQAGFDAYYRSIARERIAVITEWCDDKNSTESDLAELDSSFQASQGWSVNAYIDKAKSLFLEELNSDWNTASGSLEDYEYTKYGFDQTWQIFLAMEGLITFKTDDDVKNTPAAVEWNGYDKLTEEQKTQTYLVNLFYNNYIAGDLGLETYKTNLKAITSGGWTTASNLLTYVKNAAMRQAVGDDKEVPTVSGITTERGNSIGSAKKIALNETCDILKVRINGVDPKAIYNLSFTVAPMHYYSTQEEIEKFDPNAGHFGVSFLDGDFFDRMRQIQVPLGAGPYKATNSATNANGVPDKSDFFRDNIVYFERNTYFYTVGSGLSNAKIKKLRYKVVASTQLFDAITGNAREVIYGTPTAKQSIMTQLNAMKDNFGYQLADNLGYGYIGVNAGEIEELEVRQAIMHAMDVSRCMDYYADDNLASIIYRPMTSNSWAYPKGCKAYYAYDSTGATSKELVESIGYSINPSTRKYVNAEGKTLKFTFTIAGDTQDHPAYSVMQNAADILNKLGFEITVTTDANALKKLSNGELQVWAAAWSSTIDPDMYQVYHKESNATSVNNWGYDDIYDDDKADIYYREIEIIDELSEKIEDARKSLEQSVRAPIYSECLDLVMDLAVELPTYQRKNLFVYNTDYIDASSLATATAYQSPLSRIWTVSLKEA